MAGEDACEGLPCEGLQVRFTSEPPCITSQ